MDNSMKVSGGHGSTFNQHHGSHGQNSEPQSYAKQPRKAQSQDRMPASGGVHHASMVGATSHFGGGHSTFSNLQTSVLSQQKRASSAH